MRSRGTGASLGRAGRARRAATWSVLTAFLGTLPGAPAAIAAPQGERVVHGQASFQRDGATTTITTGTRETIVDYDRFDVGAQERVRIDQPDRGSRILNRVPHGDESRIDGVLSSNGIVYILNPAGVFIGDRAVVDVGGLVAGAGALSNQDFLSGVDHFTDVTGDIGVAAGAQVHAAGDVALIGRRVENFGSIVSEGGLIAFVAGDDVLLTRLDGHIAVRVDGPQEPPADADFALTQAGHVEARGVTLAAGDTYSLAMNHTGVTRADEIHVEAGPESRVQIAGTLDATNAAPGGQGGSIRVQGGEIAVDDAVLDASGAAGGGEILVGGDLRGGGDLPTARQVEVGSGATLRADATDAGNGGKIIVFADEHTRFYGSLSARGGAAGGDGGFAEISGAQLAAGGHVDLGAAQGRTGTLLYDPDKVVIRGGTGTPSGDGSEIFESGLETTNANIVIEATNRIETSGTFDHDANGADPGYEGDGVVVILPGKSLTLRTTGKSAPEGVTSANDQDEIGIDLTAGGNENLTWRVSQGGNLTLDTRLATLDTPPPDAARASIKVGRIESTSASYKSFATSSLDLPADRSITISTTRGDIEVGSIGANGENATPPPADDGDPKTVEKGRSASAGAEISITASQGDITILGPIEAKGGSGVVGAPSPGANGPSITIGTEGGNLTVQGPIDASGGDGLGAIRVENASNPSAPIFLKGGGAGGAIALAATGDDPGQGELRVLGNLTANGGAGLPDPAPAEGDTPEAQGGLGGAIAMSAQQSIQVGAEGSPLVLEARGGDGSGAGGSARGGLADLAGDLPSPQLTEAFRLTGPVSGQSLGSTAGEVAIFGTLIATGGNARVGALGVPDPSLVGGVGGRGGDALILPGTLDASQMLLDASGGDGSLAPAEGTTDPRRDANGNVFVLGGQGGTVSIVATQTAQTGRGTTDPSTCCGVIARGGNATNGSGGAGGIVSLKAGNAGADPTEPGNLPDPSHVLVAGDIDVSGGDALPESTATQLALAGGVGGTVELGALEKGVGQLLLGGRIGGDGGTGFDGSADPGEETTHARGATLDLKADGAIELAPDAVASDVVLSGSALTLGAPKIGSLAPVPVAGTALAADEGSDVAQATADTRLALELRDDPGALERLQLALHDEEGSAEVTRPGGAEVLRSSAADSGAATPHTLELMQTTDADPFLAYRLDVERVEVNGEPLPQPGLAIARGAVALGDAGGEIANGAVPIGEQVIAENRGAILATGSGSAPHATSTGTLRIEGAGLGTPSDPLDLAGATGAALRLDAQGEVHANVTQSFGAIEIVQNDAAASADVDLPGTDRIEIDPVGNVAEPGSRIVLADTTASQSGFSYRLAARPAANSTAKEARLEVVDVRLGGEGLLSTRGDVVLTDDSATGTAIATRGNPLTLDSEGGSIRQESASVASIDMLTGTPDENAARRELVLLADTSVGSLADAKTGTSYVPIRTVGVEAVAGRSGLGDFALSNAGTGEDGLHIQLVTSRDPVRLGDTTNVAPVAGVSAGNPSSPGSIDIENLGSRIALGAISDGFEFSGQQLSASVDARLHAPSIEIENARLLELTVPVQGKVFARLNDAHITAGRDAVLDGAVRTAEGSTVNDPQTGESELVHGSLLVEAGGTAHFLGDVGGDGAPGHEYQQLALLDTTDAVVEGTGARQLFVGDAHFRGTLDGPADLAIRARDLDSSASGHVATVTFDGNVGAHEALGSLDVAAERIRFTSADRVVADGNIALDANPTDAPAPAATIADTRGGLSIQAGGSFTTGVNDKLSVMGPLGIRASSVTVGDVNAARRLGIDAPEIFIRARDPGPVERRDGSIPTDPAEYDTGTDLVADSMAFSSVPRIIDADPGDVVRLGLGGGGASAPGSLSAFEVRRFTPSVDTVTADRMAGKSGEVLDLTTTGRVIIGYPSEDMPHERVVTEPALPPRASQESPGPAPVVDAGQVLAYLRCGDTGGAGPGCGAAERASLEGVPDWSDSALATPRAAQLVADYRELRSRSLSAAFDAAGAGFRSQSGFGEFDAAAFGKYLEQSPEHSEARAAIHELALLLVEVDLLGLAPQDETRVRRELASQLAAEADLPGFDTDAVLTAVAATPIGLPPQASR